MKDKFLEWILCEGVYDSLPAEAHAFYWEVIDKYKECHRWVPVEEALPGEGVPVLAIDKYHDMRRAYCGFEENGTIVRPGENGVRIFAGEDGVYLFDVTHWRELPAEP